MLIGEELATHQLTRALHAQGIYVSPVAFPAVKKGTARLRVSVMATHSIEDILKALSAFEKAIKLVPTLADANLKMASTPEPRLTPLAA